MRRKRLLDELITSPNEATHFIALLASYKECRLIPGGGLSRDLSMIFCRPSSCPFRSSWTTLFLSPGQFIKSDKTRAGIFSSFFPWPFATLRSRCDNTSDCSFFFFNDNGTQVLQHVLPCHRVIVLFSLWTKAFPLGTSSFSFFCPACVARFRRKRRWMWAWLAPVCFFFFSLS